VAIELHFPQRAARRIGNEKIAMLVESKPVRDERL